jgi:hypothetical protein
MVEAISDLAVLREQPDDLDEREGGRRVRPVREVQLHAAVASTREAEAQWEHPT